MKRTHEPDPSVELELDPWLGRALRRQRRSGLSVTGSAVLVLAVSLGELMSMPADADGASAFLLVLASLFVALFGVGRLWAMGGVRRGPWTGADLTVWKVRSSSHEEDFDGFTKGFTLTLDAVDPSSVSGPAPVRPTAPGTSRFVDVRMFPASPSDDSLWSGKVVVLAQARDGVTVIGRFPKGPLYRCGESPWSTLTDLFRT